MSQILSFGTQVEAGLSKEDHQLLSGALDYKDKRVKDVMTPIARVYSFEASARLNFATMMEIYRSGGSQRQLYLPSLGMLKILPDTDSRVWQCKRDYLVEAVMVSRIHTDTGL